MKILVLVIFNFFVRTYILLKFRFVVIIVFFVDIFKFYGLKFSYLVVETVKLVIIYWFIWWSYRDLVFIYI